MLAKPDPWRRPLLLLRDAAVAIEATRQGTIFAASVAAGKELVLCEVQSKDGKFEYSGGKWAASQLRVIEELMPMKIN